LDSALQNMTQRFINILKKSFELDDDDLNQAIDSANEKDIPIGQILVRKKVISENQLLKAFSRHYDIPILPRLILDDFNTDFTEQIPIQFLKKYAMVPFTTNNTLEVGGKQNHDIETAGANNNPKDNRIVINDPTFFQALDDLIRVLKWHDAKIVISSKTEILSAINAAYDLKQDSPEQLVQDMEENGESIISEIGERADLLDDTSDAPIIRLTNHILSRAVKARASDIHIEPYQDSFKIRYRVDGILYDFLTPPKWIQPSLTSRVKVMSKMNIAENRLPQDGRFDIKIGDQEIDIRVSTIPTSFGERVVLRLLNKTGSLLQLSELGLEEKRLSLLENLVKSPNGIILVSGPTGSGKTTSLYSILSSINNPNINIITIEDPVEYQLKGINQIQVNPKIDLTFANGLRSIVRQDPDVILVGEIRDKEPADIAVQSALTGHLVFSTLHTNDAASAITRLVDIRVEPFLISSSVIAVIAQRLIRVLCDHCKRPHLPDELSLKTVGITKDQIELATIYQSCGCEKCLKTGYSGRIGIFEILVLDDTLKSLVLKTFDSNQIKNAALNQNMITLRQDGIQKILEGVTTIEEVLRIAQK